MNYFLAFIIFCITAIFSLTGCSKPDYSIKEPSADIAKGECVALIHGMGRSYRSMNSMQDALTTAGYHTVNLNYPSTKKNIQTLAKEHFPIVIDQCQQFNPEYIHFVTHSLGGIIIRQSFIDKKPENLGKTVMLSPPNKGSAVVDNLRDWLLYKWLNGPAGQQLSTTEDSVPNQLGPVDFTVGIITGNRHAFFDKWLAELIPGKDDGKVSIDRTKIEGMTDFMVVSETHPYIMDSENVQAQTIYFLLNGRFKKSSPKPQPELQGNTIK